MTGTRATEPKRGQRGKWGNPFGARPQPSPAPRAWCYICSTPHVWAVACPPVPTHRRTSKHRVSP